MTVTDIDPDFNFFELDWKSFRYKRLDVSLPAPHPSRVKLREISVFHAVFGVSFW